MPSEPLRVIEGERQGECFFDRVCRGVLEQYQDPPWVRAEAVRYARQHWFKKLGLRVIEGDRR